MKREEKSKYKNNIKGLIVKIMSNNNKWETLLDNYKHRKRKSKYLLKLLNEKLDKYKWRIKN